MINAEIVKNKTGNIIGFTVKNHGESKVCAAVSLLTINTVNSIEAFTDDDITCAYDEKNLGYIDFSLSSLRSGEAGVLLDAMALGLTSVSEKHPNEISIKYIESEC